MRIANPTINSSNHYTPLKNQIGKRKIQHMDKCKTTTVTKTTKHFNDNNNSNKNNNNQHTHAHRNLKTYTEQIYKHKRN